MKRYPAPVFKMDIDFRVQSWDWQAVFWISDDYIHIVRVQVDDPLLDQAAAAYHAARFSFWRYLGGA